MFYEGAIPHQLLEELMSVKNEQAGARLFFTGTVRADVIEGSKVTAIEFTAQQTMCEMIKKQIIEESIKMHHIWDAKVFHSLGIVTAGATCFLISVQSGHRSEGFEALRYIVDEVKKRCPIFGKELLENGYHQWKKNIY